MKGTSKVIKRSVSVRGESKITRYRVEILPTGDDFEFLPEKFQTT